MALNLTRWAFKYVQFKVSSNLSDTTLEFNWNKLKEIVQHMNQVTFSSYLGNLHRRNQWEIDRICLKNNVKKSRKYLKKGEMSTSYYTEVLCVMSENIIYACCCSAFTLDGTDQYLTQGSITLSSFFFFSLPVSFWHSLIPHLPRPRVPRRQDKN